LQRWILFTGRNFKKEGFMKRFVTLVVVGAALLVPAGALASSSTCQAYNPQLCSIKHDSSNDATNTTATPATNSQSTLPFTGLDVVLLVAGGGSLLGAGLVVRRLSRHLG
jgi:hypothetical protein